jgi:hypothetical protein
VSIFVSTPGFRVRREYGNFRATPQPPEFTNLRVRVSPTLYTKIGEHRHTARHDSKNHALVTLLAAGLATLAKPPSLPPPAHSKIPFAGAETDDKPHRP